MAEKYFNEAVYCKHSKRDPKCEGCLYENVRLRCCDYLAITGRSRIHDNAEKDHCSCKVFATTENIKKLKSSKRKIPSYMFFK